LRPPELVDGGDGVSGKVIFLIPILPDCNIGPFRPAVSGAPYTQTPFFRGSDEWTFRMLSVYRNFLINYYRVSSPSILCLFLLDQNAPDGPFRFQVRNQP